MTFGNGLARLIKNIWSSSNRAPKLRTKRPKSAGCIYDQLQQRNLLATFTGTGFVDDVVINFVAGRPATIEINGQSFVNPDNTLHVDLRGANFDPAPQRITLLGDDFDVVISAESGSVNGNAVTFDYDDGSLFLSTDSGNDIVEVDETIDTFRRILDREITVDTGGGDDTFILNGSGFGEFFDINNLSLEVFLGDGDDRFIENVEPQRLPQIDSGNGFDVWEARHANARYTFAYSFERAIAQAGGDNSLFIGEDTGQVTIDGNLATLFHSGGGQFQHENFNEFRGVFGAQVNYQLREVTTPLTFNRVNNVILGGDFLNGDTSAIHEQVTVTESNALIVSQSGSDQPQDVFINRTGPGYPAIILGLTPKAIFVDDVVNTILAGGTANDRFFVSAYDQKSVFDRLVEPNQLILYGNEGDDRFLIGHNQDGTAKDLQLAANVLVNIVAGAGNDYTRVDDSDSDQVRRLRVRNNFIHSTGSSPDQGFGGVTFTGVEDVEVKASALTDLLFLTPSLETRFVISGGRTDLQFNSLYLLREDFIPISTLVGPFSGFNTYLFDFGFQNIFVQV